MKPSAEEIAQRVDAIAPILAANAEACVQARSVVPESMKAMVEAGLFRICQPARVGGYELSLRIQYDTITAVSQACPSSGWILMVMGAHHFCLGSWPDRGQEEVFGEGRDGLVSGTLAWQGKARAAEGGYRVDGRWQFCSGVDRAEWVILGCADAESGGPGVHVVVPRRTDHRGRHLARARHGGHRQQRRAGEGSLRARAQSDRYPRADERLVALHLETRHERLPRLGGFDPFGIGAGGDSGLGEIRAGEIRRAHQGAPRDRHRRAQGRARTDSTAAGRIDGGSGMRAVFHPRRGGTHGQVAQSGQGATDMGYRARVKWQAAYAAELCRRALSRLFAGSGAHAVYDSSPLQAAFRNVNVGAQHASIDFDTSGELYGRMRLGLLSTQG